jgi:hypothetical protein
VARSPARRHPFAASSLRRRSRSHVSRWWSGLRGRGREDARRASSRCAAASLTSPTDGINNKSTASSHISALAAAENIRYFAMTPRPRRAADRDRSAASLSVSLRLAITFSRWRTSCRVSARLVESFRACCSHRFQPRPSMLFASTDGGAASCCGPHRGPAGVVHRRCGKSPRHGVVEEASRRFCPGAGHRARALPGWAVDILPSPRRRLHVPAAFGVSSRALARLVPARAARPSAVFVIGPSVPSPPLAVAVFACRRAMPLDAVVDDYVASLFAGGGGAHMMVHPALRREGRPHRASISEAGPLLLGPGNRLRLTESLAAPLRGTSARDPRAPPSSRPRAHDWSHESAPVLPLAPASCAGSWA